MTTNYPDENKTAIEGTLMAEAVNGENKPILPSLMTRFNEPIVAIRLDERAKDSVECQSND